LSGSPYAFLHRSASHRDLPSFPTRRSSDLDFRRRRWAGSSLGRPFFILRERPPLPLPCDTAPASPNPQPQSAAPAPAAYWMPARSEEHTSELQSRGHLVCRLLLEKKNRQPA